MNKIDEKQIQEWKGKYGADSLKQLVFYDGKQCILRKPDAKVINLALKKSFSNGFGIANVIVSNCWLAGDEVVKKDHRYLMEIQNQSDDLFGRVLVDVTDEGEDKKRLAWEDGKQCVISIPDRECVNNAIRKARSMPLAMPSYVIKQCWVEGDEGVKTSIGHIYGAMDAIDDLIDTKKSEIKNL